MNTKSFKKRLVCDVSVFLSLFPESHSDYIRQMTVSKDTSLRYNGDDNFLLKLSSRLKPSKRLISHFAFVNQSLKQGPSDQGRRLFS